MCSSVLTLLVHHNSEFSALASAKLVAGDACPRSLKRDSLLCQSHTMVRSAIDTMHGPVGKVLEITAGATCFTSCCCILL